MQQIKIIKNKTKQQQTKKQQQTNKHANYENEHNYFYLNGAVMQEHTYTYIYTIDTFTL